MSEPDKTAEVRFDRFLLDHLRRSLTANGKPVPLQPRTFDLLTYLIAHRDRVVGREEILAEVFGGQIRAAGNVPVQVYNLRRAISEAGGEAAIIQTVGSGYRFIGELIDAAAWPSATYETVAHELEPPAESEPAVAHSRPWAARQPPLLLFIAVGLIAALAAAFWHPHPTSRTAPQVAGAPPEPPPHSIAVLAFTNLSGDPVQDYLSDGLAEELIEALSQIRQVQVTARTSSFFFKGKPSTIKDIAQALNVAAVVEGSVRRQGDHLRIEVRLTDARTGFNIWSRPFDSGFGNLLKLEGDIAAAVAGALKVQLVAGDVTDRSAEGAVNPDALDAYLRGVQNIRHDSMQSYRTALANFDSAIAADPNFALAYAGKANALVMIFNNQDEWDLLPYAGSRPGVPLASIALSAAKRGVELAPESGGTHIALANVFENTMQMRPAWAEAEQAEALNPGDATVDLLFSFIALSVGRREEALQAARRAIKLDPLREDGWLNLGQQYRIVRNYDDAFKAYQHAQTLAGGQTPLIAYERALAYITMGNPQRALDIGLGGSDWTHLECRAISQALLGRQDEAEQTLAELIKREGNDFRYVYAEVFAQWRRPADALRWLTAAKAVNDSGLSIIKFDPMMDPIRQEPGFKAIVRSLDFPE